MYDIHSHVLPGIDDGAKSLEDSVALCRIAAEEGVEAIVATPHIREGRWPNRRCTIASRVDELNARLQHDAVPIRVVLGAEIYFACGIPEAVREGEFPTYADGRRYLLLELSNHFIARQVQNVIFELRTAGVTPIIAHPERNPLLMSQLSILEDFLRMGCLTQLTGMSVAGKFGRGARKASEQLLERRWVHFVASDTHHPQFRPPRLRMAWDRIVADYGVDTARLLFVDNPRAVIEGGEVAAMPTPAPARRRGLLARLFAR